LKCEIVAAEELDDGALANASGPIMPTVGCEKKNSKNRFVGPLRYTIARSSG